MLLRHAVGDEVHREAAWTHEEPSEEAEHIRDHVAFRRGVEIDLSE